MNREYRGLDGFRLAAALLVAAIHTSPLASYSATADFILTRILARTAVPFFFMVSGFFLISHYADGNAKLYAFLRKTARIYGAAILLYLPVNVYMGYFQTEALLPKVLQDVFFDGTLYHLWYLPAAMMGAGIAWYLVRRVDFRTAFAVTAALYVIALLGDSYFGLGMRIPFLRRFYGMLFQIFDYTRNGIFFAPVFFVLGGWMAERRERLPLPQSLCGLAVSLGLMTAEGLSLRAAGLQRHDSMYFLLPVCMYFLFSALLHVPGKGIPRIRTVSLLLYLLHPIVILGVRLAAKLCRLEQLLVGNSVIHYLAVCSGSLLCSVLGSALLQKRRTTKKPCDPQRDRAYIELHLQNLGHNIHVLRKRLPPGCALMAVVKAQAYGHGAYETSTFLEKNGVGAFAVATIEEGIELRRYGIRGEILILGYTNPARAGELARYRLTQTLSSFPYAAALEREGRTVRVQPKIDTGMHRLGMEHEEEVRAVFRMKHLQICGMYTHLCCSESRQPEDTAFTEGQTDRFFRIAESLRREGLPVPALHLLSSYGLANFPECACDFVRTGLALYGMPSLPEERKEAFWRELRPVLSLKCRVVLLRDVPAGESVGYHRSFTATRDSRIAVLSIGYGDGLPRGLSNGRGRVLIRGQAAPIVGQICMDQLMADVTDISGIREGDIASILDAGDERISAAAAAEGVGSISNEVLSRLNLGRLGTVVSTAAPGSV